MTESAYSSPVPPGRQFNSLRKVREDLRTEMFAPDQWQPYVGRSARHRTAAETFAHQQLPVRSFFTPSFALTSMKQLLTLGASTGERIDEMKFVSPK